jgi:hypothetical protein
MFPRLLFMVVVCLLPGLAWAQGYTVVLQDIPSPSRPGVPLMLKGLNTQHLLGVESFLGGFSAVIDVSTQAVTKVECPNIPRSLVPSRGGPDLVALAHDSSSVGNEETPEGLSGVIRQADGTCLRVDWPGAVGTFLTARNGVGDSAGWYFDPLPRNLLGNHGFLRRADGMLVPLTTGPNDVAFPDALNDSGAMTGHAYRNVNPLTNEYTYGAWYRNSSGQLTWVVGPNGETEICLPSLTNGGIAVGHTRPCNDEGGEAYLYNVTTGVWTPFPKLLPEIIRTQLVALAEDGRVLGRYTIPKPTSQEPYGQESHWFVATPTQPPPPAEEPKPRKSWFERLKERWDEKWNRPQDKGSWLVQQDE